MEQLGPRAYNIYNTIYLLGLVTIGSIKVSYRVYIYRSYCVPFN
jgi:hypothetical protein